MPLPVKSEFRVREVRRYVVTRYSVVTREDGSTDGSSTPIGEFDNWTYANEVANALDFVEKVR